MFRALWLLLLVLYGTQAMAYSPTWGGELTFTDKKKTQRRGHHARGVDPWSRPNQAAMELYYEQATRYFQGRPDVERVKYKAEGDKWGYDFVRVQYRDGFRIHVTMDPYCLEAPLPPLTLPDLKNRLRARLQTDLWEMMDASGFEALRHIGGGHLHLGAESAFDNDALFFCNWVVDQANHTELATGAREKDDANAAPFVKLSTSQRYAFAALVERVHRGEIRTARKFATEFYAKVIFEGKPATGRRIMEAKYWQLNFLRMADLDTEDMDANASWANYEAWVLFDEVPRGTQTAELRAKRSYLHVDELILDIELEEGRLNYIRGLRAPLKLSADFIAGKIPTIEQGAQMYFEYIVNAGKDPKDYLFTLPRKGDNVRGWETWQSEFKKLLGSCPKSIGAMGARTTSTMF